MIALLTDLCERACWFCDRQLRGRWLLDPLQRALMKAEHRLERRREAAAGIDTYGSTDAGPENSLGQDSVRYSPINCYLLRPVLDHLKLGKDDVFVDLGCGKGRAVLAAAERGCSKAIGVELSPELAEAARTNADHVETETPIEIIEADAATWDPGEGTVFFLFNPFGASTMQRFLENLHTSLSTNPRAIRIAYICYPHEDLLNQAQWLESDNTVRWQDVFKVWRSG